MKVVLALLHFSQLRNFTSVVEELAARGHDVVLAAEEADTLGGGALAQSLADGSPHITLASLPPLEHDATVDLGTRLRVALDYFRFHDEPYASAPKLRERLRARVPRLLLRAEAVAGRRRLAAMLARIERSLPMSATLSQWLREQSPQVLLLTSLTHYRSAAPELHRAAAALGIPTAACIYSWDHLSSKALLRRVPDAIFVWNDVQAAEAVELHQVPQSHVVVTGAQCYDQWYGCQPSRDHAPFCAGVGLDPERRYLLYVCSALTPSPDEPSFVRAWITALRESRDPAVRDLGVLIRPHPERANEWAGIPAFPGNVVVRGGVPTTDAGKREYFDAIFHAEGVVGLVTSAFLEAAIAGRPVFTITLPQFARHQHDMRHFRYLLDVAGGLPAVAETLVAHVDQVSAVLGGEGSWRLRQEQFLRTFVRPMGAEAPTVRFVSAVTALGDTTPVPTAAPVTRVARLALRAAQLGPLRRDMLDEFESRYARGLARKASVKRQKVRAKRLRNLGGTAHRWLLGRSDSKAP